MTPLARKEMMLAMPVTIRYLLQSWSYLGLLVKSFLSSILTGDHVRRDYG